MKANCYGFGKSFELDYCTSSMSCLIIIDSSSIYEFILDTGPALTSGMTCEELSIASAIFLCIE